MKASAVKLAAGAYEVVAGETTLGYVNRTGRPGVDDYPWEWYLAHGIESQLLTGRATGLTDTKAGSVELVMLAAGYDSNGNPAEESRRET